MIKICKIFYDNEEGLIFNSDNNKHEVFHSRSKFGSLASALYLIKEHCDSSLTDKETIENFSFNKTAGNTSVKDIAIYSNNLYVDLQGF